MGESLAGESRPGCAHTMTPGQSCAQCQGDLGFHPPTHHSVSHCDTEVAQRSTAPDPQTSAADVWEQP
jgi:hypothetical protein